MSYKINAIALHMDGFRHGNFWLEKHSWKKLLNLEINSIFPSVVCVENTGSYYFQNTEK